MELVVVGVDGASFELLDPWIEEGLLPNLARIKQRGVWADMDSVLPPVTAPNWKCYSTGKNPGKIGIFWWEHVDWRNRTVSYTALRKAGHEEIWDYLGEAGMKVGVLGVPITCPKKVNGFMIAGGPAIGERDFAYPSDLEEELRRRGWRNHPKASIELEESKAVAEICELIDMHFRTARSLSKKYQLDFLQMTTFHINILHHFLWDGPGTRRAWKMIDEHLGELMNEGCDLIIMSDHGANKIRHVFNINRWLEKEGYLRLRRNLGLSLYRLGIDRRSLGKIISRLQLEGITARVLPKGLMRRVPSALAGITFEDKAANVDWRRSTAVASGQGPIYLNPGNQSNEKLREEIKQKLETLTDPVGGDRIVERAYYREEIYHGEHLACAPDLVVDQARGIHIPGGIGQRRVFGTPQRWVAENKKTGLFMAYGPVFGSQGRIGKVSILDLAPTILHLMDVPIPGDMDGEVKKQIFEPASEPAKRRIMNRRLNANPNQA